MDIQKNVMLLMSWWHDRPYKKLLRAESSDNDQMKKIRNSPISWGNLTTWTQRGRVVRKHVCVFVCIHLFIHVFCASVSVGPCFWVSACLFMYVMYVCVCMCACVFVYVCLFWFQRRESGPMSRKFQRRRHIAVKTGPAASQFILTLSGEMLEMWRTFTWVLGGPKNTYLFSPPPKCLSYATLLKNDTKKFSIVVP